MKKILLSGKDICKIFDGSSEHELVLNKVNVDIYEGDFTIIMGASGAGKSTLLYALSGMDKMPGGKVYYKEQEISNYNEKQMATLRSQDFGFVFQQTHLVSNLTLFENVVVAGYLNKKKSAKEVQTRAEELLQQMNVETAKNRIPSQVSGGEAQRAAMARAMIHEPGLIFADEPTGALNKRNSDEILHLLTSLNESGQSILMVTHDLRAALRGNRILYLEDGQIIDEMIFSKYVEDEEKGRESKITEWLTSMQW